MRNYEYDEIGNLIQDNAEGISNIEWTVYGKVKLVDKVALANGPDLEFAYGPDGQRISKKAIYGSDSTVTTYYVRDADGNIMAVYHRAEFAIAADEFYLVEQDMYSFSRLGYRQQKIDLLATPIILPEHDGIIYTFRGYKRYELSNHLGNVLTVVSDRRKGMSCASGFYSFYEADIISASDLFAFGMQMPDRNFNGSDAKNGMNGMRRDDEWSGSGNSYSTEYRQYDPRLGRWMSLEPRARNYPSLSPYLFSLNKPISSADPKGDTPCNCPPDCPDVYTYFYRSINISAEIKFQAGLIAAGLVDAGVGEIGGSVNGGSGNLGFNTNTGLILESSKGYNAALLVFSFGESKSTIYSGDGRLNPQSYDPGEFPEGANLIQNLNQTATIYGVTLEGEAAQYYNTNNSDEEQVVKPGKIYSDTDPSKASLTVGGEAGIFIVPKVEAKATVNFNTFSGAANALAESTSNLFKFGQAIYDLKGAEGSKRKSNEAVSPGDSQRKLREGLKK